MVANLDLTVQLKPSTLDLTVQYRRSSDERQAASDTGREAERRNDPSARIWSSERSADGTRRSVSGAVLRDRHRARLGWSVESARSGPEISQPGGGVGARRHRTPRGAQDALARRAEPRLDRGRAA